MSKIRTFSCPSCMYEFQRSKALNSYSLFVIGLPHFQFISLTREYFYSVIFEISDKQMQFAGLKNTPKQKKTDTLINQSQEIRPQGLDLGRSTSIRGCTSAQIKTLRPYFSIFSITVVRICLRKQQSKFFTNMLTTPSIEHVNIWFDSASP